MLPTEFTLEAILAFCKTKPADEPVNTHSCYT